MVWTELLVHDVLVEFCAETVRDIIIVLLFHTPTIVKALEMNGLSFLLAHVRAKSAKLLKPLLDEGVKG